MKYVKMLGLLAVAAAAMMAFAGVASATTLTSPANTTYTSTIKASSTHTVLDSSFFGSVTCAVSSVEGKVESHGAGVTAGGKISSLSFSECGNDVVTVLQPGSLEVHGTSTTGNGTLTSTGAEILVHINPEGLTCTAKTSSTDIGTLTGSNITKGKAVLDINSSSIPMSGFFCPSSATWTGTYTVNTPSTLEVH